MYCCCVIKGQASLTFYVAYEAIQPTRYRFDVMAWEGWDGRAVVVSMTGRKTCKGRNVVNDKPCLLVFITDHNSVERENKHSSRIRDGKCLLSCALLPVTSVFLVVVVAVSRYTRYDEKFILCIMDVVSLFDISFDPFLADGIMAWFLLKKTKK